MITATGQAVKKDDLTIFNSDITYYEMQVKLVVIMNLYNHCQKLLLKMEVLQHNI